eukprot:4989996-Karenia_brevis.AAC.1
MLELEESNPDPSGSWDPLGCHMSLLTTCGPSGTHTGLMTMCASGLDGSAYAELASSSVAIFVQGEPVLDEHGFPDT